MQHESIRTLHPSSGCLTHVADKLIDIDLGTSQAQGRLTTHGDEVFTLSTIEASMFEVSDLVRIATGEYLVDQLIIVSVIITRVELLKFIPVIMKDLFKDISSGVTLGSVISISPLSSMDCNGPGANFAKPLSNDFNRLGGKCPNRRP